jgi:arylsulfatase A-like enzyme
LVSSGLDLLPTLCDYAGIPVPSTAMGRSLRPIADGQAVPSWREYVVSENHTGRMLRSRFYKYCVYSQGQARESLVDLRNDPGEMNNLASEPESRAVLLEHRRMLHDWIEATGDRPAKVFAFAP